MSSSQTTKAVLLTLTVVALLEIPPRVSGWFSSSRRPRVGAANPRLVTAAAPRVEPRRRSVARTRVAQDDVRRPGTHAPRQAPSQQTSREEQTASHLRRSGQPLDSLGMSIELDIPSGITTKRLTRFLDATGSELVVMRVERAGGGLEIDNVRILRDGVVQHLDGVMSVRRYLDERSHHLFIHITHPDGGASSRLAQKMGWSPSGGEDVYVVLSARAVDLDLGASAGPRKRIRLVMRSQGDGAAIEASLPSKSGEKSS